MLRFALFSAAASLGVLLFVVIGYPLLVRLRARGRQAPATVALAAGPLPSLPLVSVVIATRDAPSVVAARVDNLRASTYPAEQMQIVVAVDAKAEHTLAEYAAAVGERAEVIRGDEPGGKASGLNAGVRAARGDVLAFADSKQVFSPNAITDLVTALHGERVGAVSGMIVSAKDDPLMDRYWLYEVALRRRQAAIHSIICVSGAVYVMRREFWTPMPDALICDDLWATYGVVLRGWRVGYCETARAEDPRTFTREQHFDRKVRTLTGLLQFCTWRPDVLVPWKNAMWIDFAIHKLTRIFVPYLALVVAAGFAVAAYLLLGGMVVAIAVALGIVAAVALLVARPGLATSALWGARLFTIPVIATANALRGRWHVWTSHSHGHVADHKASPPTARSAA